MKVLIARLYSRQFEWLKSAYQGPHELDFIDSAADDSIHRIKTMADRADKVVVLTKFISHSHWDVIPREKMVHSDSVNLDRLLYILDSLPEDEAAEKKVESPKPPKVVVPRGQIIRRAEMSTSTTREINGIVLTTAVPIPETASRPASKYTYPFGEMQIGESFFIEETSEAKKRKLAAKLSAMAGQYARKHPAKKLQFKTSVKMPGGVRVWRVPYQEKKASTKSSKSSKKSNAG